MITTTILRCVESESKGCEMLHETLAQYSARVEQAILRCSNA